MAPADAEKRVALVIGNGSYAHIAHLPNVANDAAAMAYLFRAAKFDAVDVKHNLGSAELRKALREFSGRAADADVAVLFYAGHGIEVGQTNYLIPVDARLTTDYDVEDETVALDRVLQAMEAARRLRLVLLDACRENPFVKSMKRASATRYVGRGLGRVEPSTTNTLIAFATKPNAVAEDGKGPNSPFTAALLKHLLTPGLDLRIALGHVRDEVLASTARKQEPYVVGSLGGGTVSIAGEVPKAVASVGQPPLSEAAQAWAAVKDSTSIAQLEVVAGRYKGTVYADLAQARVAELRKQQTALAVLPPGPHPAAEGRRPAWMDAPIVNFGPNAIGDRQLRPLDPFQDCADCPTMVVVPAGSFMMGSPPGEAGRTDDEGPQHRVTLARPFAVGKFEVTFAEWAGCVAAGGCAQDPLKGVSVQEPSVGKLPITGVSWNDITMQYLPWLSHKTGKGYRLLTEAEWEYAARAGTTTRYAFGDMIAPSQAQFSVDMPREVGTFQPNAFALHDMHGSVWEWVQDCWNASYKGAPVDGSAWTVGKCDRRVIRSGSYNDHPSQIRSAKRGFAAAAFRRRDDDPWFSAGFRVARTF